MPTSETAGLLFASKENAQVSLGAENPNASLGVDAENVPLSLYEIVVARPGTQQRARIGNKSFTLLFIRVPVYPQPKIAVKYRLWSNSTFVTASRAQAKLVKCSIPSSSTSTASSPPTSRSISTAGARF